jgi:ketosteroid isomerase-like protein
VVGLLLVFGLRVQPVTAHEVDTAQFERLMATLAQAWSNQDTRLALSCFTSDALYMQPPDQQLYRGTGDLEKLFGALRPGTVMTFHTLAFDPRKQVGFGEFSFGSSGAPAADHGVAVVQLRDGRIASWREYFEAGPPSFAEFVKVDGKTWKWTVKDLP